MAKRDYFPIPSVINPPGRRCIQIEIPDDPEHVQVVAGLLKQLTDWFAWLPDNNESGRQLAAVYKPIFWNIDWSNMSCCPEITNRRYNADGTYEVSYDGGETWEENPADDPRESAPLMPPLDMPPGDDLRCEMANNIVGQLKANVDKLSGEAGAWGAISGLIAVLGELLIFLGITAIIPPISVLLVAIAGAILIVGQSAFSAAFTGAVWDELLCLVFCRVSDTGDITQENWEALKTDVSSAFSGIAGIHLSNVINIVGVVGLTNMVRTNSSFDQDCEDCMCGDLDCGFITNSSSNRTRWHLATERLRPADFPAPLAMDNTSPGIALAAPGGQTMGAYTEFDEPCYITNVTLFTLGRGGSSKNMVAYKAFAGDTWHEAWYETTGAWSAGTPHVAPVNHTVVAIQLQSTASAGQNNYSTVTIGDPTP